MLRVSIFAMISSSLWYFLRSSVLLGIRVMVVGGVTHCSRVEQYPGGDKVQRGRLSAENLCEALPAEALPAPGPHPTTAFTVGFLAASFHDSPLLLLPGSPSSATELSPFKLDSNSDSETYHERKPLRPFPYLSCPFGTQHLDGGNLVVSSIDSRQHFFKFQKAPSA